MPYNPQRPVVVQSDHTLLLEVDHPDYEAARDELLPFAELVKSPEHVHTYRITPLSLWNAAAGGIKSAAILAALERWSKFDVPDNLRFSVEDNLRRYGRLKLYADGEGGLYLTASDPHLLTEVERHKTVVPHLLGRTAPDRLAVRPLARGLVKQALLKLGHPVEDLAGYLPGTPLALALRTTTAADAETAAEPFVLRSYQVAAADAFWAAGGPAGGSGIVCLPCGAGKTIVGLAAMARVGAQTLILCSSTTAVHQWIREILRRTTLSASEVGEYTGGAKEIRPVTVATYNILTSRRRAGGAYAHLGLFNERDWGLVIYDEVHLLPAPIFRVTAEIQARRRLGLTATLVREDGRADDVFALIGPKRYDVPWRELEAQGWIATAECHELRVELPTPLREAYSLLGPQEQFRLAAENPVKDELAAQLVAAHAGERVLIIGHFVAQLERLAQRLKAPLLTGTTPQAERERHFDAFRRGQETVLVVSRVANFAVDLPEASVGIEVSGLFGSRQEEAQRLGRVLRPKSDGRPARFYALISRDTCEQTFAQRRQLFLAEQGYRYLIRVAEETGEAGAAEAAATSAPPTELVDAALTREGAPSAGLAADKSAGIDTAEGLGPAANVGVGGTQDTDPTSARAATSGTVVPFRPRRPRGGAG